MKSASASHARSLTRAVIPAAGFGTRMLPAAKAVPKELLPILDRPTIQYVLEETATAGITNVLLVTAKGKESIQRHFAPSPELQQRLAASGKKTLLADLDHLIAALHISSVLQPAQHGLGDAVAQTRQHIRDEPFLCLLGDTIFSPLSDTEPAPTPAQQLVHAYREFGTAIIGLEQVQPEKVDRYGIVGGTQLRAGVWKLDALVEKPSPENAPSRLAIAARYVLTPAIFDCLDQTPRGKGNEIQLTDALRLLLQREPIHGILLNARRHDIGNPVDWLKTNLIYASRDANLWAQLQPLLRELLK